VVRRPGGEEIERVLVLATLAAPQRRLLRGRKGRSVEQVEPEPVPTARATVIRPRPFGDEAEAAGWLEALRGSDDSLDEELTSAVAVLNLALHLHRCAQADHAARDVSSNSALVLRVGYGAGEAVAEGRFGSAWELPRHTGKVRRSIEAPDERFASMLGGREAPLACEEVVLRARADLDAGRHREAALQARIGLESLLAELPGLPETRRAALDEDRSPVGTAANTALRAQPDAASQQAVAGAVERMEAALRGHRLG
jgi:hypothetical protein